MSRHVLEQAGRNSQLFRRHHAKSLSELSEACTQVRSLLELEETASVEVVGVDEKPVESTDHVS